MWTDNISIEKITSGSNKGMYKLYNIGKQVIEYIALLSNGMETYPAITPGEYAIASKEDVIATIKTPLFNNKFSNASYENGSLIIY